MLREFTMIDFDKSQELRKQIPDFNLTDMVKTSCALQYAIDKGLLPTPYLADAEAVCQKIDAIFKATDAMTAQIRADIAASKAVQNG
jgi:hypothetical protein